MQPLERVYISSSRFLQSPSSRGLSAGSKGSSFVEKIPRIPRTSRGKTVFSNKCKHPLHSAVFLDRDGVLNHAIVKAGKPYSPASLDDLVIVQEAKPALQALKAAGFLLIVVTNQPDIARGKTSLETVQSIHQTLSDQLPLDDIWVCYHDDPDDCDCRKPKPGLLWQAAKRHPIDFSKSFLIGDRWRDIEAGQQAGCLTVWLDHGYADPAPNPPPTYKTHTLADAVQWILKEHAK